MSPEQKKESTAVVERAQGADSALARSTDADMARALVASGFFPTIKTASQAIVKIQAGKELGFGPVASMMGIHVFETKGRVNVQLSANMVANLIRRSGRYDFRVTQLSDTECRIRFYRDRQEIGESQFNQEDAERAGLWTKDVWQHHPRNMLFNRAMTNGAKWFCSEVMLGAAVPVGASDLDEPQQPDVDTDTGEIIDGEPVRIIHEPPEGYKPNWSEFWTVLQRQGWEKPTVHAHFGVPDVNGALKEYAEARAESQGVPLTQVVGEMLEELRQKAPPVERVPVEEDAAEQGAFE